MFWRFETIKLLRSRRPVVAIGALVLFITLMLLGFYTYADTETGGRAEFRYTFESGSYFNGLLFALYAFYFAILIVLPIFAAAEGGAHLTSESAGGTMQLLLARPISRSRIFATKLVTAVVYITILAGAFLAVTLLVGLVAVGIGQVGTDRLRVRIIGQAGDIVTTLQARGLGAQTRGIGQVVHRLGGTDAVGGRRRTPLTDEEGLAVDALGGAPGVHSKRYTPEATAASFTADGWFRTGDQGYLDEDVYLFITGRLKEIVNRGGEKISPREVDEILMDHPAVVQVVTFAVPHDKLGEEVAAAVVLRAEANSVPDERAVTPLRGRVAPGPAAVSNRQPRP